MDDAGARPSSPPKPSGKAGCAILVGVLLVVVGVVVAIVLTLRAGGDTLARIALTDRPSSASFRLDAKRAITLWTEVDVTHAGISAQASTDELPHVLDYVVVVTRQGEKVAELRCNPFDSHFAKWTSKKSRMGEDSGRAYDGRIEGCAFEASPGEYVVTAHRGWVERDPRFRFAKTDLIVRGK